ncbi:MAG: hypothetical protein J1F28_09575 [Oscillospiraceae bacterium]|nr:hypothetical protein [Oscillospiraceae bacterium]
MVLRKIMVILFSAVVLCTSLVATTSAETMHPPVDDNVAPAYVIASDPYSNLRISGQTAYCTSKTYSTGAVSITVEQTLEKYSGWFWIWDDVDGAHWIETEDGNTITVVNTKDGLSNGTYRLKSVFTLTNSSGKTETITIYSAEKKVG